MGAPGNASATSDGSLFRVGESIGVEPLLVYVSLLVVCIVVLEQLLHKLEHSVKQSRKHEEMLRKAYRELMILGFLGIAIKVYKEITHVNAYSTAIIAFQCADLTIFILAVALILQAICVYLALRHENYELEEAELLSSSDLASTIAQQQQQQRGSRSIGWPSWWRTSCKSDHRSDAETQDLVELRVLRHLFLRRYGLPELFPFSKYVRQAQDNQITHMIDVEISMWLLLLAVAWAIDATIVLIQQAHGFGEESHAIVLAFLVFSWSLVGLHVLVAIYFRRCVVQLLNVEGLVHTRDTVKCLTVIGEKESAALHDEMADDALIAMQEVQERQDAKYRAAKLKRRRRQRHHLVERDTGFQLLATAGRHVFAWLRGKRRGDEDAKPRDSRVDSITTSTTPAASIDLGVFDSVAQQPPHETVQSRRHSAELSVQIRWFSRKAWQFVVMVIMMLNAFYLALLCQCVFYQFGQLATYSSPLRAVIVVGLPLPVVLNMVMLQPQILRNFMIVSSILQVDVATLSKVVTHFSEIVELRAEFVRMLLTRLATAGVSRADFKLALETKDRERSGRIELEQLRSVLRAVGFRLSHFRFNSVSKLLFQLKGSTVEYAQVLRMIALAQPDSEELLGSVHEHPSHPGHVLLRQSVFFEEGDEPPGLIAAPGPPRQEDERRLGLDSGDPHSTPSAAVVGAVEPARASGLGETRELLATVCETSVFDAAISLPPSLDGTVGEPTTIQRHATFARRRSSFQNTSARTLRSLYHLNASEDEGGLGADPLWTIAISQSDTDTEPRPASPSNASVYVRM